MTQQCASPVPIVLAGAAGYGRVHLANIRRLAEAGLIRLVGVCDTDPGVDEDAVGAPVSPDLADLVHRTQPHVVVIATPIHTHAALATVSLEAGASVLLEKPPVASVAEHEALSLVASRTGGDVEVGFQDTASPLVPAVHRIIDAGTIGDVVRIAAAGAWVRTDAYWTRSPWAGRRVLAGRAVVDGALTNPFAHAVSMALAVDRSEEAGAVLDTDLDLYRVNDIEADDTSCLRVRTARGGTITVAVTLCAETNHEPWVRVVGTRGHVDIWYKTGVVQIVVPDGPPQRLEHTRQDQLERLVRRARGEDLPPLVPLARTRAFTDVLEAVRSAVPPLRVPPPFPERLAATDDGTAARWALPGVDRAVVDAATTGRTFAELQLPWALAAHAAAQPADA